MAENRQRTTMALAGFMLSGPVVHSHAVWRHPQTHSHFLDPDYYIEIAKTLEDGCFDLLFFADRPGSQGIRPGNPVRVPSSWVRRMRRGSIRCQSSACWPVTPGILAWGLHTAPPPTTNRPMWRGPSPLWTISQRAQRLEYRHLDERQRSAPVWPCAALAHDQRYARADEFVELVLKLWNSWQPDALVLDRCAASSPTRARSTRSSTAVLILIAKGRSISPVCPRASRC